MNNEQQKKGGMLAKPWVQSLVAIVVIFGALGGFLYWHATNGIVSIENSYLDAPTINIAPSTAGTLNTIYVKQGDHVEANTAVAVVGAETLYAKEAGIVSDAPVAIGSYFSPGQKVISLVVNGKMRVIGSLEETKGLDEIKAGQGVRFTVDAFGSKSYEGTVDEISPISDDAGVVFSISDKREIKKFDVYVTFDATKYPELKTGMSAKMKVYVQ